LVNHAITPKPPSAERIARWRKDLSREDRAGLEEEGGDLIVLLGDYAAKHRYVTQLVAPEAWASARSRLLS
jgi:hypothetical protein